MKIQKEIYEHKGYKIEIKRYRNNGRISYKYKINDTDESEHNLKLKGKETFIDNAREEAQKKINNFLEGIKNIKNMKFKDDDIIKFKANSNIYYEIKEVYDCPGTIFCNHDHQHFAPGSFEIITENGGTYIKISFYLLMQLMNESDYISIYDLPDEYEIIKE